METNRRVDRWAASARTIVDDFTRLLPPGVKAEIIFDQSIHTDERLGGLVDNLLIGAAIVVVVLFFMMGLRAAIIVASALPLPLTHIRSHLHVSRFTATHTAAPRMSVSGQHRACRSRRRR